jgi:hypothetical protein
MSECRCKTCGKSYFTRTPHEWGGGDDGLGHRAASGHWPVFGGYIEDDATEETTP